MTASCDSGDYSAHNSPLFRWQRPQISGPILGMKKLSEIVRPIAKTLIVNRALAGKITTDQAQRLLALYELKGA